MLQQVMSLSAHQEDILAMFQFASWFEELFQFAGGWLLNPREGPRGQAGPFPCCLSVWGPILTRKLRVS